MTSSGNHDDKADHHHHKDDVEFHDDLHHMADVVVRVRALENLLSAKGLVDVARLDSLAETLETKIGPHVGARAVARAWVDPQFKAMLLNDGAAAVTSLGFTPGGGEDLVVVENTPSVRNVIVCTLCSCYPWSTLGLPPTWYKSTAYRSRVVREPRAVLAEFGSPVADDVEVRVWDSNSEVRYMVLPERPAGTEAYSEEQLFGLVTRDSMVGVSTLAPVEAR